MPMKMGIHCKPIGHSPSALLDSRLRGNDGRMAFGHSTLLDSRLRRNDGGMVFGH